MSDLTKRSLAFAEGLLRAVAPDELGSIPIYMVDARDAPWGDWHDCYGATHAKMDVACRAVLESRHEWQGRGFAAVVNVEAISQRWPRFGDRLIATTRTALHEATHWLTYPLADVLGECDGQPRLISSMAYAQQGLSPAEVAVVDAMAMLRVHNPRWIRALCHVSFRANGARGQFKFGCKADDLADHNSYGLTRFANYSRALGGELVRCLATPIREVLATKPPREFIELAAMDVLERSEGVL